MRQDTPWLELVVAMEHLATGAPQDAVRGKPITWWYARHHGATGRGAVISDAAQVPNRLAEQLRDEPEHLLLIYHDDDTRDSIERHLFKDWPPTLRTVVLVDGSGDQPQPTHILYRECLVWFMAERVPGIMRRPVPRH